jgi:2'-5' RNA ligase
MDTYAIVLYFDDATNKIIGNVIERAAALSGNSYMLDINIPPHVTLGCFFSDEQSDLPRKVESFEKSVTPFEVTFNSIGAFEPYVLFVSPVKDECLTQLNNALHKLLLNDYEPAENANYLPDRWMPHCSLAVRLDAEQFAKAKAIESEIDLPFTARVTKIALAKCNPYNVMATWNINEE